MVLEGLAGPQVELEPKRLAGTEGQGEPARPYQPVCMHGFHQQNAADLVGAVPECPKSHSPERVLGYRRPPGHRSAA